MVGFNIFSSCFFLIILCSCQHNLTQNNQEWIIGDWYPLDSLIMDGDYPSINNTLIDGEKFNLIGYEFKEDGLCVNKLGFFEYQDPHGFMFSRPVRTFDSGSFYFGNVLRFWGNNSSYIIKDDSLKIYDPITKAWYNQRFSFSTKDTLILSSAKDSIVERYLRKEYDTNKSPLIDQIIIRSPLITNAKLFSIQRNGNYFSSDCCKYLSVAKIDLTDFERLETMFKMADIETLLKKRANNIDPKQRDGIMITFILNNKMYTINHIFNEIYYNNREFYWAYFSTFYLPETMHLSHHRYLKYIDGFYFDLMNNACSLNIVKNNGEYIYLSVTEQFYLATLLFQSEQTDDSITTAFNLKIKSDDLEFDTDGRFFRLHPTGTTFDIGFNFIEENELEKKSLKMK